MSDRERIWVAELLVTDPVASKIRSRHGLDPGEVRDALVGLRGVSGLWHHDPVRGTRLLVELSISSVPAPVVLYPVESPLGDVWALATAFRR